MRLSIADTQRVILHLLNNQDHRALILALINAQFLEYTISFFAKIAQAKLQNETITEDWYKREFILNDTLATNDIIINAGLNKKTVENIYKTANRQLVLDIAPRHYDELLGVIQMLTAQDNAIDLSLTIKLRGVSVDLNINESLIVINTLAVKRAQLRGGAWSTLGKQLEKPLMHTLCHLFQVPPENYHMLGRTDDGREVDFYLVQGENRYPCEIKLMGKGNPESADAIFARQSAVFIVDVFSEMTKQQAESQQIHWVELSAPKGYLRFYQVLNALNIPAKPVDGDLEALLLPIFAKIF